MTKLSSLTDRHAGSKALIIGCGTSAKELIGTNVGDVIKIGVNDSATICKLDYLLLIDRPNKFSQERISKIFSSDFMALVSQIEEWKRYNGSREFVHFQLGSRSGLAHFDKNKFPNILDYSNNSPYVALLMAYKIGIKEIGMIGVDFTPNHFYSDDGDHQLVKLNRKNSIIADYATISMKLKREGVSVFNLSKSSIIDCFKKTTLAEFIARN